MKKIDGTLLPAKYDYEAWCPDCLVYLRKKIQGRIESDWIVFIPKKSNTN